MADYLLTQTQNLGYTELDMYVWELHRAKLDLDKATKEIRDAARKGLPWPEVLKVMNRRQDAKRRIDRLEPRVAELKNEPGAVLKIDPHRL
jgi:hypothetical protein